MSIRSDSSIHEDEEQEIIGGYEDLELDDDHGNEVEGEENDNGHGEGDGEDVVKKRVDPTAKKHIVRNKMLNLNTGHLKGPKGIYALEKYFEGFRYHGKGHEKTDLDRIMKRLEHWSHRLFPKLNFDDFLDKTEKLAAKKDLKVFLEKYRMDMITPDSDLIIPDDNEEIEEDNAPIDAFDELIAEQIDKQQQAAKSHETSMLSDSNLDISMQDITSTNAQDTANRTSQNISYSSSQSTHNISEIGAGPSGEVKDKSEELTELTDEIRARIERNRLQAIERRMARLRAREEESKRKKLEESENVENTGESSSQNNLENIDNKNAENVEKKNAESAENRSTENIENKSIGNIENKNSENTENTSVENVENKNAENVENRSTENIENKNSENMENRSAENVENINAENMENENIETINDENKDSSKNENASNNKILEISMDISQPLENTKHKENGTDENTSIEKLTETQMDISQTENVTEEECAQMDTT